MSQDDLGQEALEPEPIEPISLRDYFAGKALSTMLVEPEDLAPAQIQRHHRTYQYKVLAESAYRMADAMMEARSKE
jgi:hypothetical protein